MNRPIISQIVNIRDEAKNRRTITVKCPQVARKAQPGQFIMVWIPGVDEIPMGLSYIGRKYLSFTVHIVGEATKALCQKHIGELIGIRGPYGRGFTITSGKVLVVGGGTGMAPLIPLIEKLIANKSKITVINGAKTMNELLFLDKLRKLHERGKIKLIISTDDGSMGLKGYASDIVKELLLKEEFNEIYICGPEIMIVKILRIANKARIHVQALLERYIKCAIGICGSCIIDPLGVRVCKDGPVFPSEVLNQLHELGRYRRNAAGIKEKLI